MFLGVDLDDIIVGETETNRYSEYFPVSLQPLYGSINPECSKPNVVIRNRPAHWNR